MSTFSRRRRLAAGVLAVSGLMATAMGSASAVAGAKASASALRIAGPVLPIGTLAPTIGGATATGDSAMVTRHIARVALPETNPVIRVTAGTTTAETRVSDNDKAVATANLAGAAFTPSSLLANQTVSQVLAQARSQLEALRQQAAGAQQAILGTVNVLGSVTGSVTLTALGSEITLGGEQSAELQQIAQQIVGMAPEVDPIALADELTGDLQGQIQQLLAENWDFDFEAIRTLCRIDANAGVATGQTELVFSPQTWSRFQALNPPALGTLPVTTTQGGNVSVQIPANTTVDLAGVVKLVLNEQTATGGQGGASYTVNGARLQVAGLGVTLASSHCEIGGNLTFVPQIPENDVLGLYVPEMHPYLDLDINGDSDTGNLLGGDLGNALGVLTGGGNLDLGLGGGVNPSGPLGLVAGPLSFSRTLDPIGGRGDLGAIGQVTASLGGLLQLSGLMP